MNDSNDDIEICPGFILDRSQQLTQENQDDITLIDVEGVHFRKGRFRIETVPGLDYRIEIKVKGLCAIFIL